MNDALTWPQRESSPERWGLLQLVIGRTWDGHELACSEHVHIALTLGPDALVLEIDAPAYGDCPPPSPPGSTPGLWEYEVVELFFLGDDDRYLELEFGPHGHYLVLEFHGARRQTSEGKSLHYEAQLRGGRWSAAVSVPRAWLPAGLARLNAHAIHGEGSERRYLSWRGASGKHPDFHRLQQFGNLRDLIGR